jgi:hypothetical protein
MSAKSDYLENKYIDHTFRGLAYPVPTVLAIALFTGAPSDVGGGVEISGGGYARAQLDPSPTNWRNTQNSGSGASTGTGGQTANAVVITFPVPTGAWGLATHFAICDALVGGNVLYHAPLAAAKTINNGDPAPTFPVGTITVTEA